MTARSGDQNGSNAFVTQNSHHCCLLPHQMDIFWMKPRFGRACSISRSQFPAAEMTLHVTNIAKRPALSMIPYNVITVCEPPTSMNLYPTIRLGHDVEMRLREWARSGKAVAVRGILEVLDASDLDANLREETTCMLDQVQNSCIIYDAQC